MRASGGEFGEVGIGRAGKELAKRDVGILGTEFLVSWVLNQTEFRHAGAGFRVSKAPNPSVGLRAAS